jgi:hypothetical protein
MGLGMMYFVSLLHLYYPIPTPPLEGEGVGIRCSFTLTISLPEKA